MDSNGARSYPHLIHTRVQLSTCRPLALPKRPALIRFGRPFFSPSHWPSAALRRRHPICPSSRPSPHSRITPGVRSSATTTLPSSTTVGRRRRHSFPTTPHRWELSVGGNPSGLYSSLLLLTEWFTSASRRCSPHARSSCPTATRRVFWCGLALPGARSSAAAALRSWTAGR
jgi:hypothetical protein